MFLIADLHTKQVSSNEFLPSPLESFVPFVSKSFRNDWQIRICQLSKCLVDFRGLTIWLLRGLWVISEKNILQTDFKGEKLARI